MGNKSKITPAVLFVIRFLCLFALLYGFYIGYLSLTSPGGKVYAAFLDHHLNFISGLRYILIECSSAILTILGFETKTSVYQMLVVGHNIIHVGYDCLGFGVMCFFAAFVIAYPASLKSKLYFGGFGLLAIQILNVSRFIVLSLYWRPVKNVYISDHHTMFNILVYIIIAASLYFYIRYQDKALVKNAAN
ncbi:hypothetical protein E2R65_07330 [Mucilaginibacter phyllosphaerae]|uniref:Exosortase/archaeosortase family protein n=1 Tax=Mucilaginibacter phyllosphaerae TaxID=1812349 RepID=A0A4Y8AHR1_9SPHI|nr:hypothetical protein [Mucilaginibacter phyllosphaerae]MBB3968568.1 exosortase/archaeosortase family protein [Mucilaginibacter phyllosphaerae]TEW67792.1 hypothetical protein E2R65_07330 [Mucilaginibacter phyllosphaerae]GGH15185.1 hypothetical protein GCM10007352_23810 [Mucilaginibacter phyllosphaerae]